MNTPKSPRIIAPESLVRDQPVHDYTSVAPSGQGCPNCDDYPDFPAKHCGRPGCRDAQIIAYARATGIDPAQALEDATRQAQDAHEQGGQPPPPETEAAVVGLCGSCVMVEACIVGQAVAGTAASLGARVAQCEGHRPRPQTPS